MFNCHCSDCRKANGKLRGEPRFHKVLGDQAKLLSEAFVQVVEANFIVKIEKLPDVLAIQACTLDDPTLFSPSLEFYTDRAPPWDHMQPATKKFPKGRS